MEQNTEKQTELVVKDSAELSKTDDLQKQMALVTAKANELTITDDAQYAAAAETLNVIKAYKKTVKDRLDPFIAAAKKVVDDAKAGLDRAKDEMAKYLTPAETAETALKGKMSAYAEEQRRKATEQKRKDDEAAKKKAEDEALARAQALEDMNMPEQAAKVLEHPVAYKPTKVATAVPKVAGVQTRELWSAEVTDLLELVKAVAAGQAPLEYLVPNMPPMNKRAIELKTEGNIVPGVKAKMTTITV